MVLRISASILLIMSVLFMPFWLSVLLVPIFMFYFSIFWEAVLIFLLSDLLYGTPLVGLWGITYISFLSSALLLLVIELLKKKLKFY